MSAKDPSATPKPHHAVLASPKQDHLRVVSAPQRMEMEPRGVFRKVTASSTNKDHYQSIKNPSELNSRPASLVRIRAREAGQFEL